MYECARATTPPKGASAQNHAATELRGHVPGAGQPLPRHSQAWSPADRTGRSPATREPRYQGAGRQASGGCHQATSGGPADRAGRALATRGRAVCLPGQRTSLTNAPGATPVEINKKSGDRLTYWEKCGTMKMTVETARPTGETGRPSLT